MARQGKPREYRFKIDDYTPETMPLGFLTECLNQLAKVLGDDQHLHLMRVEKSSTSPVIWIDAEAEAGIKERAREIKQGTAAPSVVAAVGELNKTLRNHKTKASLIGPRKNNVIPFPGIELPVSEIIEYGPVNQAGTLDGVPMTVGGTQKNAWIHLRGRQKHEQYNCTASHAKAKDIAQYLFTKIIRVRGLAVGYDKMTVRGRWSILRLAISNRWPMSAVYPSKTLSKSYETFAQNGSSMMIR